MAEFLLIAPALALVVLYSVITFRDMRRLDIISKASREHDLVPIGLLKQGPQAVIGIAPAPSAGERGQDRYVGARLVLVRDGRPEVVDARQVWDLMEHDGIIWHEGMQHQKTGLGELLRYVRSNAEHHPELKKSLDVREERELTRFMRALPFILVLIWLGARWANRL